MKAFLKILFVFHVLLLSASVTKGNLPVVAEAFFIVDEAGNEYEFVPEKVSPNNFKLKQLLFNKLGVSYQENKRFTAFALTLLLGPFGVHRLYLGTKPVVPVAYTLTLGGGLGIIPLIDAGMILFTKDLSKLENNPRFFLWAD